MVKMYISSQKGTGLLGAVVALNTLGFLLGLGSMLVIDQQYAQWNQIGIGAVADEANRNAVVATQKLLLTGDIKFDSNSLKWSVPAGVTGQFWKLLQDEGKPQSLEILSCNPKVGTALQSDGSSPNLSICPKLKSYVELGLIDSNQKLKIIVTTSVSTHPVRVLTVLISQAGAITSPLNTEKILALATCEVPPSDKTAICGRRLNSDGSFDIGYGTNGILSISWPGKATARLIRSEKLSNGKIVIFAMLEAGDGVAGLARLNSDGTLDNSFGTSGLMQLPLISGYASQFLLNGTVDDAGNIYTVYGLDVNQVVTAIGRRRPNGSVDPSFGTGGIVYFYTKNSVRTPKHPCLALGVGAVAVQADGKILLAGRGDICNMANGEITGVTGLLARLNRNGSFDTSFRNSDSGMGGVVYADQATFLRGLEAIEQQPDGKILVAYGRAASANKFPGLIIDRFNSDGNKDNGFGVGGRFIQPASELLSNSGIINLSFESSGKIRAIGTGLIRILPDGTADPTLKNPEILSMLPYTPGLNAPDGWVPAVGGVTALQSDGKILTFGDGGYHSGLCMLSRHNGDGSLDSSFGNLQRRVNHLDGVTPTPGQIWDFFNNIAPARRRSGAIVSGRCSASNGLFTLP